MKKRYLFLMIPAAFALLVGCKDKKGSGPQGGGGGGAPVYDGEFAVTCSNSGTYSIAGGTMYVDGTSLSGAISTTASFTGTANGIIWANIYKSGNSLTGVYAATRSISGSTCSVPIAKVNGTSVTQYQYGPIRIEGRWA